MATGPVYVLHGLQLPSAYIGQMEDGAAVNEAEFLAGYSAGHVTPMFRALMSSKPGIDFGSTQLATVLDQMGLYGGDFSAGNVDLFWRRTTNKAARNALNASTAYRMRAAEAFGYWEQITAAQRQNASISGKICCLYDGSNAPLVPAGSQTLSGTPAASTYWTLGPVVINGTPIDGVQSVSISNGINVVRESDSGNIFDVHCHVESVDPVIQVDGLELEDLWAFGITSTAISSVVVYLRKKSRTGNVADGTSEHISFTGSAGNIVADRTAAGGNQRATTGFRILLDSPDASTDPLTIDTTAAIS